MTDSDEITEAKRKLPNISDLKQKVEAERQIVGATENKVTKFQKTIYPLVEAFRDNMKQLGFQAPTPKDSITSDRSCFSLFAFDAWETLDDDGDRKGFSCVVATDGLRCLGRSGGYHSITGSAITHLLDEDWFIPSGRSVEAILVEKLGEQLNKAPYCAAHRDIIFGGG